MSTGRKPREPMAQLVHSLRLFKAGAVIDLGANEGQYASALRRHGWREPILSIEPIPAVHERLSARAAADPAWMVLPPMAVAAEAGEALLEVSAESDMSSLLPQTPLLRRISPTSALTERLCVRCERLDSLDLPAVPLFLKLDLQGGEAAALAGATRLMPRLVGLQVEMSLVELYAGEALWRETVDRLEALGFVLHLLIPGYYERKLGRQLQVDGVFYRRDLSAARSGGA
jgi:FkbM family methyltransferase